jgi:hypothetical protein
MVVPCLSHQLSKVCFERQCQSFDTHDSRQRNEVQHSPPKRGVYNSPCHSLAVCFKVCCRRAAALPRESGSRGGARCRLRSWSGRSAWAGGGAAAGGSGGGLRGAGGARGSRAGGRALGSAHLTLPTKGGEEKEKPETGMKSGHGGSRGYVTWGSERTSE